MSVGCEVLQAFPKTTALYDGMELRDYFAAQAIGAVIRQCAGDAAFGYPDGISSMEQLFADKAYSIADAMMAEREKPCD